VTRAAAMRFFIGDLVDPVVALPLVNAAECLSREMEVDFVIGLRSHVASRTCTVHRDLIDPATAQIVRESKTVNVRRAGSSIPLLELTDGSSSREASALLSPPADPRGEIATRCVFFERPEVVRRSRMMSNVIRESRRRGLPRWFTWVGPAAKHDADAAPDEVIESLFWSESRELLLSASAIVEPSAWDDPFADESWIGCAVATVVTHGSSRLGRSEVPTFDVEQWSADAFCDALALPPREIAILAALPLGDAIREVLGGGS
jgi:hypothetical protein